MSTQEFATTSIELVFFDFFVHDDIMKLDPLKMKKGGGI